MNCITVKKSSKGGKGVFAARDFKKGEVVLIWDISHQLSREQIKNLSQDDQNHTNYIGTDTYTLMQSPEKFVDHSCEPNTYVKNQQDIALIDIEKGEEITTDYSLNGIDDWEMQCNCGTQNCRKVIYGDFRKLDLKTKKRLYPYLEEWYKREIKI
ncbi:SET domain-containing protein-lysine N-methyltransferase [Candidatus Woesearchaeota archaeon]|nr:SET domain-containing protein-lysine N-methyltransferase [Candidatus Woesearchaeota archaeon]